MSTNPRDTQFQGFADLVFDKLSELGLIALADVHNFKENPDLAVTLQQEMNACTKQILANAAYDLVRHAIYCDGITRPYWPGEAHYGQASDIYERETTAAANNIPDMRQWPEVAK